MKLKDTFAFLAMASLITGSTAARAEILNARDIRRAESVPDAVRRIQAIEDTADRRKAASAFADSLLRRGRPIVEDTTVYLFYLGTARRVGVPSDLNGWTPFADTMTRLPGTRLFTIAIDADSAARFEYKFCVDSTWILDPFNMQQAMEGFGPNSEVWMPAYRPPRDIQYRVGIPHGTVDTLAVRSTILGRTYPVFVYLPPGYASSKKHYPSITVMDGGEYLSLGLMNNVLDNLIAEGRIRPVIGIFQDPRTDIQDSRTSRRMSDYGLNDRFIRFLVNELRPRLRHRYRLDTHPEETAIMGASLGGLAATYAWVRDPKVFGLCAAQSPAYQWQDRGIFAALRSAPQLKGKLYLSTGTIHDAQKETQNARRLLEERGCTFRYAEFSEAHNWANWRARLSDILTYFWGTER